MFTFIFDESCANYFVNNDEYNKEFIECTLANFAMILEVKKYLYMRDILEAFGADPFLANVNLGWDKDYGNTKFYYEVKKVDENYQITVNPVALIP